MDENEVARPVVDCGVACVDKDKEREVDGDRDGNSDGVKLGGMVLYIGI